MICDARPGSALITQEAFDTVAGPAAINHTIFVQNGKPMSSTGQDPYAAYAGTCDRGDVQPILPQLHIRISTDISNPHVIRSVPHLQVEYSILSAPDKKQDKALYNLWPSLKRHLGSEFPLTGPYCYGNDAKRAYTVRLSYDSRDPVRSKTWQVVKGCVEGFPCWDDGGDGTVVPYDNGSSGIHTVDPTGWVALVCYLLGFALIVSVVFNVQLSNQLRRIQNQQDQNQSSNQATTRSAAVRSRRLYSRDADLEEPLLPSTTNGNEVNQEQQQPQQNEARHAQFSSSAFEALNDSQQNEPEVEGPSGTDVADEAKTETA